MSCAALSIDTNATVFDASVAFKGHFDIICRSIYRNYYTMHTITLSTFGNSQRVLVALNARSRSFKIIGGEDCKQGENSYRVHNSVALTNSLWFLCVKRF